MTAEEFDAFYAASFRRLVGQLYAICGDFAEANDCVQEAFVRAWDRRRTLEIDGSPEGWIRTVAYRLAVSRWRRLRRGRELADRSGPPSPAPGPDESRIALAAALRQLPIEQRQALVLHYLVDLPVAEIAAEVGAPVGTVKARLSRGRSALAALLREEPVEKRIR